MIYHSSLISFYLCLQMLILVAEAFQVEGPYEPLVFMLGDEAELSCSLWPPQNVENMQITWTRSLPSQMVHQYKDGRDKPEEAMPEYFGRRELMRNAMNIGIVTLKIFNVQPSDRGKYRCAFQHGSDYGDTTMELRVEDAESIDMPVIITVSVVTALLILLIFIGLYIKRNKLQNWWKNRNFQGIAHYHTCSAMEHTYATVPNCADPADPTHAHPATMQADTHDTSPTYVDPTDQITIIDTTVPNCADPADPTHAHRATMQADTHDTSPTYIDPTDQITIIDTTVPNCADPADPIHAHPATMQADTHDTSPTYVDPTDQITIIDTTVPNCADPADPIHAHPATMQADTHDTSPTYIDPTDQITIIDATASAAKTDLNNRVQSKYDPMREEELRLWIEGLTGTSIGPNFQERLEDGVILCTLMNKLQPNSVAGFQKSRIKFCQRDNLSKFIEAMKNYGVKMEDLFGPNDLCENENMWQVQVSLLALKKKAEAKGQQCGMDICDKYLEKQERNFDETMKAGRGIIQTQMGASQSGMTAPSTEQHINDTTLGTDKRDSSSISGQTDCMQGANQSSQDMHARVPTRAARTCQPVRHDSSQH